MSFPDPIAVFRTEAAELLEQIEAGLLDLNVNLGDKDRIDAVFRGLHTLKGSGAMFGFDALAAFTHHCETAFDRVRKGEVPATQALITAVLEAKDHMRALVETPAADHEATSEALLANLRAAVEGADNPSAAQALSAPARTLFKIRFSLPQNAMANGTNPLPLLDELRELGECRIVADRSTIPSLDLLSPTDLHISWNVELLTSQPRSAIEDVFIFVMDDMQLEITAVEAATSAARSPESRETPVQPAEPAATEPVTASASRVSAPVTVAPLPTDAKASKTSENVRVPAEKLDELMDRVGELVIAQSRLSQLAGGSGDLQLRAVSEDVERLSGELRDTMMVLRMVPVTQLFGRFRRLVHDLSHETGKMIELVTEGESTEVDKSVIERLADPLVHLVRNSCDHGLETPDERLAAGKPQAGRIMLSARQQAGEVIITIKDDGRGINRERVRAKAEASGLIPPNANLTDQELYQLIFQPGFSTAQQVTNLSGRGVGMDVVKRTIDALRGTINVASHAGQGSEISLAIPLTLAIIDGLLVRVGAGRYVIPLSAVEECLELSIEEDMRSRGRSFISLRDSLVPFLRLRDLFRTGTKPDPFQKVVVISTGSERVGLVVDQIIGDHQTVIKAMSKLHHDVATFSGATILGDGDVALILDVGHLVTEGQQQEAHLRAAG
ncbi:two-component system chemotaxis sensor kinase CheA [Neorhizobium sp. R1-B]|jgi:two-component system, chemotaxis family, sensor kinase CheA|uniref:chemotaxis protein CheA n=1 Tax=unclassified Neorhizobium TaxID=2629175 RepID=UPI0010524359|nr:MULTISPECIES: chemotaxis protein CheA [unclassified Neorhizobium]TCV68082.1 two-component system chemotaxis sensor kinase CheA [Neorhizobium sp. S3-V5DH]TDX75550.1 two-component system chemotaxis sensor kinase CheA [Neorhizobium sp. R1-B]